MRRGELSLCPTCYFPRLWIIRTVCLSLNCDSQSSDVATNYRSDICCELWPQMVSMVPIAILICDQLKSGESSGRRMMTPVTRPSMMSTPTWFTFLVVELGPATSTVQTNMPLGTFGHHTIPIMRYCHNQASWWIRTQNLWVKPDGKTSPEDW